MPRFEASSPARAKGFIVDVTDEAALTAAVESLQASDGWIDILVNNAGYGLVGAIEGGQPRGGSRPVRDQCVRPHRRHQGGAALDAQAAGGPDHQHHLRQRPRRLAGHGRLLRQQVRPRSHRRLAGGRGWPSSGSRSPTSAPAASRTDYSGRSLRTTGQSIEDYEGAGHFPRRAIPEHAGHEPGDPAKAALAILKVADAADPPLNLLLGPDAVHYATQKIATLLAELGQWTTVTHSIDHDALDAEATVSTGQAPGREVEENNRGRRARVVARACDRRTVHPPFLPRRRPPASEAT